MQNTRADARSTSVSPYANVDGVEGVTGICTGIFTACVKSPIRCTTMKLSTHACVKGPVDLAESVQSQRCHSPLLPGSVTNPAATGRRPDSAVPSASARACLKRRRRK